MASGICREAAPAVFGADSDGWVTLLDATPNSGLLEGVLEASDECPTSAISLVRSSSTPDAEGK